MTKFFWRQWLTRYEKDPEYLEQINKQKCPYCQCPLKKPYSIKRQCTTCDFEHYGNPELTAYKVIEPEISYSFSIKNCVECSTTLIYERDKKELVCPKCGLLHTGPPICGVIYPFGPHTNSNFILLK